MKSPPQIIGMNRIDNYPQLGRGINGIVATMVLMSLLNNDSMLCSYPTRGFHTNP